MALTSTQKKAAAAKRAAAKKREVARQKAAERGKTKAEQEVEDANTEPGGEPMEAPAVDGPDEPAKPGPKKGSKNQKATPSMARQKPSSEISDMDQRLIAGAKAINADRREYNKRHGTNMAMLPEKMALMKMPKVELPDGAIGGIIIATGEVLGEIWDVEARASKEAVDAADKAWQPVVKIFIDDPTFLLVGAACGATVACYAPMFTERREIKSGKLAPASKRTKQLTQSSDEPDHVDPDA